MTSPFPEAAMKTHVGLLLAAVLVSPAFADEEGVRAKGTLEPGEVIDVAAQVSGTVLKFGADPADPRKVIDFSSRVEEGTVLAQLDPERYKLAVEKARAALEVARAEVKLKAAHLQVAEKDLARFERLIATRAVSQEEFDMTRSRVEVGRAELALARAAVPLAEAVLKAAEADLNYTTIRAPVKGVVIDRRVNVGQMVSPNLNAPSLFVLAKDLEHMHAWVTVGEADVGQVRRGQAARVRVDAFPGKTFEGKVAQVRLNAAVEKGKVAYTVVVTLDNPNGMLLPYLTADVHILTGKR
jgi:HlyD family secretion protein